MKRCVICTGEFEPRRMGQKTDSPICEKERKRQVQIRKDRVERLKTRSDHLKETEHAFNAYIRRRDRYMPCISCGRSLNGTYHAGHYRSVGAAPQLRFHEDNVHGQCVECNLHRHGNAVEYRIRLIQRIGVDRVEALEACNGSVKYTIDDAKRIKAEYKQKLKDLSDAA